MSHRPRKRFGQNFLHDPNVIQRIVQVINPTPGDRMVEIGPGQAALTIPLLQACGAMERTAWTHLRGEACVWLDAPENTRAARQRELQ